MRCRTYKHEDGFEYDVPGCWGAALGGKSNCTCYKTIKKSKVEKEKDIIDELGNECRMLREVNERLNRQNRVLFLRCAELQRQGLPLDVRRDIENMNVKGESFIYGVITRLKIARDKRYENESTGKRIKHRL